MEPVVFEVRGDLPPGLNGKNGLMRAHWAKLKRTKEKWFEKMRVAQEESMYPPGSVSVEKCKVIYTVFASRPMDWDNAASTAKFILDALVHLGVVPDDGPGVIKEMVVKQEKVNREDVGIRIEIQPI